MRCIISSCWVKTKMQLFHDADDNDDVTETAIQAPSEKIFHVSRWNVLCLWMKEFVCVQNFVPIKHDERMNFWNCLVWLTRLEKNKKEIKPKCCKRSNLLNSKLWLMIYVNVSFDTTRLRKWDWFQPDAKFNMKWEEKWDGSLNENMKIVETWKSIVSVGKSRQQRMLETQFYVHNTMHQTSKFYCCLSISHPAQQNSTPICTEDRTHHDEVQLTMNK